MTKCGRGGADRAPGPAIIETVVLWQVSLWACLRRWFLRDPSIAYEIQFARARGNINILFVGRVSLIVAPDVNELAASVYLRRALFFQSPCAVSATIVVFFLFFGVGGGHCARLTDEPKADPSSQQPLNIAHITRHPGALLSACKTRKMDHSASGKKRVVTRRRRDRITVHLP